MSLFQLVHNQSNIRIEQVGAGLSCFVSVEQLVDITGYEVIGDYSLHLMFEDGTVGDVDFHLARLARRLRTAPRPRILRSRDR